MFSFFELVWVRPLHGVYPEWFRPQPPHVVLWGEGVTGFLLKREQTQHCCMCKMLSIAIFIVVKYNLNGFKWFLRTSTSVTVHYTIFPHFKFFKLQFCIKFHKTLTPKFRAVTFYLICPSPRCFFKSSFSGLDTSACLQTSVLDITSSRMSFGSPTLLLSLASFDFLSCKHWH